MIGTEPGGGDERPSFFGHNWKAHASFAGSNWTNEPPWAYPCREHTYGNIAATGRDHRGDRRQWAGFFPPAREL